jgi:hypothetical protein
VTVDDDWNPYLVMERGVVVSLDLNLSLSLILMVITKIGFVRDANKLQLMLILLFFDWF